MAEGSNSSGGGGDEAAASKDRGYGVFTELTIKLDADPAEILEQIKGTVADGAKEAVALIRIGRANAENPRASLNAVAQLMDLDGDYQVIADGSRNAFDKVKSEMKRSVSIG